MLWRLAASEGGRAAVCRDRRMGPQLRAGQSLPLLPTPSACRRGPALAARVPGTTPQEQPGARGRALGPRAGVGQVA